MPNLVEAELQVGNVQYRFPLNRKAETFGDVSIDHFWMDTRRIYGQRGRARENTSEILRLYRMHCDADSAFDDADTRDSYLLATLIPYVRAQGAQRIFADARLSSPANRSRATTPELAHNLQQELIRSPLQPLSLTEFYTRTATILGMPEFSGEQRSVYLRLIGDLLNDASHQLQSNHDLAVTLTRDRWTAFTNQYGRRAGHALEKQALDAISYEAKTSFHRCYSVAWCSLLPLLRHRYGLTDQSFAFLYLWHQEPVQSDSGGRYLRPFHGHILGLHPAGATLLQTPAGRDLMAAWLDDLQSVDRFGELLHALYMAVCHYTLQRESTNEERRQRRMPSDTDRRSDRRRGRAPRRPR